MSSISHQAVQSHPHWCENCWRWTVWRLLKSKVGLLGCIWTAEQSNGRACRDGEEDRVGRELEDEGGEGERWDVRHGVDCVRERLSQVSELRWKSVLYDRGTEKRKLNGESSQRKKRRAVMKHKVKVPTERMFRCVGRSYQQQVSSCTSYSTSN